MSGYVQRLLSRVAPPDATLEAVTGEPIARATSVAPVLSPLTEIDQRLQLPELDGEQLAARLFAHSSFDTELEAAEVLPMTSPAPAATRRQVDSTTTRASATKPPPAKLPGAAEATLSSAPEREVVRDTAALAAAPPPLRSRSELPPRADTRVAPAQRPQPMADTPPSEEAKRAPGLASPSPRSPLEREASDAEVGYLVVRRAGVSAPAAQPMSGEPRVEPALDPASNVYPQPLVQRPSEASPELEHGPVPTRAEPARRGAPAVEGAATLSVLEPAPHQPGAPRPRTPAARPRNEASTAAAPEPSVPYRSAAAASVIGALPQRASSTLIRGWRRR